MNIHVVIFVGTYIFSSLGCIPRSGVVGSYANCMFNFLRNYQNIFQSSCPVIQSYKQWMRRPSFPHPHQHLLLSVFFMIGILGVKFYLTEVWGCISLVTVDVEYLSMCSGKSVYLPRRSDCPNPCPPFNWEQSIFVHTDFEPRNKIQRGRFGKKWRAGNVSKTFPPKGVPLPETSPLYSTPLVTMRPGVRWRRYIQKVSPAQMLGEEQM